MEIIGITQANLSILKTGKTKGIRFNTIKRTNKYNAAIRLHREVIVESIICVIVATIKKSLLILN